MRLGFRDSLNRVVAMPLIAFRPSSWSQATRGLSLGPRASNGYAPVRHKHDHHHVYTKLASSFPGGFSDSCQLVSLHLPKAGGGEVHCPFQLGQGSLPDSWTDRSHDIGPYAPLTTSALGMQSHNILMQRAVILWADTYRSPIPMWTLQYSYARWLSLVGAPVPSALH